MWRTFFTILLGALFSTFLWAAEPTDLKKLEAVLRDGDFVTFPVRLSKDSQLELRLHCTNDVGSILFWDIPSPRKYQNNSRTWQPPVELEAETVRQLKQASYFRFGCESLKGPEWVQVEYPPLVPGVRVAVDRAGAILEGNIAIIRVALLMPKQDFDTINKAPYIQIRSLMVFSCAERKKLTGANRYYLDHFNILTTISYTQQGIEHGEYVDVMADLPIMEVACDPEKLKALPPI
ncbi:hypothetical protein [Thauera sinica]|uniref:Uncharacterized protein n=1 Tax=Thauera sinica TaxID=2665146 RepID=A0ABW1ASA8_9RHOO|nr:hypothetical protein [Thauera sp. K11]